MEKVKEVLIKSLLQIAAGIIIAIISVSWTNSRSDNRQLQQDINIVKLTKADKTELEDKVDVTTFSEYKITHDKRHENESLINQEFRGWLKKEIQELRKDVRNITD